MNRELKKMLNFAETMTNQIESTRDMLQNHPESPVDWEKILKAQIDLLDAIRDRICDIVIEENNRPFWKNPFRK